MFASCAEARSHVAPFYPKSSVSTRKSNGIHQDITQKTHVDGVPVSWDLIPRGGSIEEAATAAASATVSSGMVTSLIDGLLEFMKGSKADAITLLLTTGRLNSEINPVTWLLTEGSEMRNAKIFSRILLLFSILHLFSPRRTHLQEPGYF